MTLHCSALLAPSAPLDVEAYERRATKMAEAIESMVDQVLHTITGKLNERRLRAIDLFRKIDSNGSGEATAEELCDGLLWMGFDPTDKEFDSLMKRVDKDGTGMVTLKEFDRALKGAEKKFPKSPRKAERTFKMPKLENTQGNTPRTLPGKPPTHVPMLEPMDSTDEVVLRIVGQMNARKYRTIDFFRTIDLDSSGTVSVDEFRYGLKKMGLHLSHKEFDGVVDRLDRDGSGDVTCKEFDKAVKLVVKKAKASDRHADLETWPVARPAHEPSTFTWADRSLRTTSDWSVLDGTLKMSTPWGSASNGPRGTAGSSIVGAGSVYDTSILRERLFDSCMSGAHPTSMKMPALPLHKTAYPRSVFHGRFELEPTALPSDRMLSTKDSCLTATRGMFKSIPKGGVKTYHKAPMLQSTVDQVVFNRDLDFSSVRGSGEEFTAMYEGMAGKPSWRSLKDSPDS